MKTPRIAALLWFVLVCVSLSSHSRRSSTARTPKPAASTGACGCSRTSGHTYSTVFPLTENPISEGGLWLNGKTDGIDWSDVRTTPGHAFGTQSGFDGSYDDSIAVLKGPWGADQKVTAVVHSINQQSGAYEEVELWLRGSISAHVATGYEINFRCLTGSDTYVQIHYWLGPVNQFGEVNATTGPGLKDGDVVSASVVGNVFTVWINGVQVLQGTDDHYSSGSPGIGFFNHGAGGANSDFGFTAFSATDAL